MLEEPRASLPALSPQSHGEAFDERCLNPELCHLVRLGVATACAKKGGTHRHTPGAASFADADADADAEGERLPPVFLSVPEPTDEDLVAVLRAVTSDRRLAEHIDVGEQDVEPGIAACVQLGLAAVSPQAASPRCAAKLLVHNQNDVGTLGSLPSHVDRSQLASWRHKLPPPQDQLLAQLVDVLPDLTPSPVTTEVKRALAQTVRVHQTHPEALSLQASGNKIPPTVHNHR